VRGTDAPRGVAGASGGDARREGSCTANSRWRLEVDRRDSDTLRVRFRIDRTPSGKVWEIEVEYEVDSNHTGQTWRVKLFENGNRIFAGSKMTQGASGSFTVRKLAANTAGSDAFRAHAMNVGNGETCGGSASIG
jgi:hypothetical protein